MQRNDGKCDLVTLTARIVAAYIQNNSVNCDSITELVGTVHSSLNKLTVNPVEVTGPQKPAVPINKSVTPDYIICLEDGKKFKIMKRHLTTAYGMSPVEYRRKWNLPPDYPMVAPNYAQSRSEYARDRQRRSVVVHPLTPRGRFKGRAVADARRLTLAVTPA